MEPCSCPWRKRQAHGGQWNSFHRLACDNSRCSSSLRDPPPRSVLCQMITYATSRSVVSSALVLSARRFSSMAMVTPMFSLCTLGVRAGRHPCAYSPESQGFHLLTRAAPKPRLVAGGIPAGIMPLGQLGHGARATRSYRTQVGSHSRG